MANYIIRHSFGIWEILKEVDGAFVAVQTNIRTLDKAKEAHKTWIKMEGERVSLGKAQV